MISKRSARGIFLLLPALALAACSSGGGDSPTVAAPTTAPTSIAPIATTQAAPPTTSAAAPTSAAATRDAPDNSPSTTTTFGNSTAPGSGVPGVASIVLGNGTTFTRPTSPTTKPYDTDCGSLIDAGFASSDCITSTSPGGTIAAFVEVDRETGQERDLVYRRSADTWSLSERRIADKGSPQAEVEKSDLNDDGDSKAVFWIPAKNEQFATSLDVVDTSGLVVIHLALDGGFSDAAAGGGLDAWFPSSSGGYDHDIIRFISGQWRVISQAHESDSTVESEESGSGFSA